MPALVTEAAVVQLNTEGRRKQRKSVKAVARPRGRRAVKALRRQALIAAGIGAVTLLIIGLSLSHSVHGVQIITGCAAWESWAMATSIEIGFVLTKLAMLIANERVRRQVGWLANCTIVGTLAGMAAMNVFAFAGQASGPAMTAAGVALGLAIPCLIFAFMRVLAALWFDYQNRGA
jgi:hypothetical protein